MFTVSAIHDCPNDEHHKGLVECIIDLYCVVIKTAHQILVVQAGASTYKDGETEGDIIRDKRRGVGVIGSRRAGIARKPGNSGLSGEEGHKGEGEDSDYSEEDTRPLPGIKMFVKDEQGTDECPDRTSGLHGTNDGDRQVFERNKGENPTAEDNSGFEDSKKMRLKIEFGNKERCIKKQFGAKTRKKQGDGKNQRREDDTECEDIYDTVVTQSDFLADVIKAQRERGYEGEESPHF